MTHGGQLLKLKNYFIKSVACTWQLGLNNSIGSKKNVVMYGRHLANTTIYYNNNNNNNNNNNMSHVHSLLPSTKAKDRHKSSKTKTKAEK